MDLIRPPHATLVFHIPQITPRRPQDVKAAFLSPYRSSLSPLSPDLDWILDQHWHSSTKSSKCPLIYSNLGPANNQKDTSLLGVVPKAEIFLTWNRSSYGSWHGEWSFSGSYSLTGHHDKSFQRGLAAVLAPYCNRKSQHVLNKQSEISSYTFTLILSNRPERSPSPLPTCEDVFGNLVLNSRTGCRER